MTENANFNGRRALLKKAAGLSAAIAAAGVVATQSAKAAGMAQSAVQYQDKPKDGHQCDGCALYIPGASATANGKCKAVAGSIAPAGWCTLWSPKS
ncbi:MULTISPECIES: high-potential iron-sulfur protein [Acidiphilium]|uniref:High-potential iron-sulfur protein n=1 Tax=Acidiphilium rubrum TaxID=526 RepID=A0A8G2CKS2_ACIRU|nr:MULTISPECIES: high-potential iron-sulfur protein [Acidiphilium]SIQ83573.1 High potential iron-sulfur protein [Acidiphilium rubrum]